MSKLFHNLPIPKFGIIGHRGAAARCPENTLASFNLAANLGLNWVEFDIQCCGSGEWIVFHDASLERTTNGHGLVADTPYEKIKDLDAGSWFHPSFKNERVPLLKDVLILLAKLKIHPNIEIKDSNGDKLAKMQDLLQHLQTFWPKNLPLPLISSFDVELLTILRAQMEELPLGYLVNTVTESIIDTSLQHRFTSVHSYYSTLNPTNIALAKMKALPLLVYTVNYPDQIQLFLNLGATAVFSDITHDLISF